MSVKESDFTFNVHSATGIGVESPQAKEWHVCMSEDLERIARPFAQDISFRIF